MKTLAISLIGMLAALPPNLGAELPRSPSPEGAAVAFEKLQDGDVVPPTFTVSFVTAGMDVVPAGTEAEGSGHHHLLVDLETLPPLDMPLPKSDHVRHFGGGETSTEITLAEGKHSLQLLFADHLHIPHDPPVMSDKITITVSAEAAAQPQD